MHHVRHRRKTYYTGWVILGPQPKNWINRHKSLGGREFFYSRLKYEYPRWERVGDHYRLEIPVIEGIKTVTIEIKFRHYPNGNRRYNFDHVFVYHAHVLRKKK